VAATLRAKRSLVKGNKSWIGKLLQMSAEQGNDEQDDHDSNDGDQDERQNLLFLRSSSQSSVNFGFSGKLSSI
jgi:hypothetical protein